MFCVDVELFAALFFGKNLYEVFDCFNNITLRNNDLLGNCARLTSQSKFF
jgi:hypothetical protein